MRKALLVVDVQTAIFELGAPLHRADDFLASVLSLVARAKENGAAVVFLRHRGAHGTPFAEGASGRNLHPALAPRAEDTIVDKEHPDGFQGTALERRLREASIECVVVCGFATEYCVDTTVRSAYARGLSVELAADAHTTTGSDVLDAARAVEHHNHVLRRFAAVTLHDRIAFDDARRAS